MNTELLASQMLALFQTESETGLEQLSATLLDANEANMSVRVNTAFRVLHSLRGSAAMNGLDEISSLAAALEQRFDTLRRNELSIDDSTQQISLVACDLFRAWLNEPRVPKPELSQASQSLIADLASLASPDDPEPTLTALKDGDGEPGGWRVWALSFTPGENLLRRGVDVLGLLDELSSLGKLLLVPDCQRLPPLEALCADGVYLRWQMLLLTEADEQTIQDVFMFVSADSEVQLDGLADGLGPDWVWDEATARAALRAQPALTADAMREILWPAGSHISAQMPPSSTSPDLSPSVWRASEVCVPVSLDRLEQQIDLVGELVIAQSALMQVSESLHDPALSHAVEQVMRLTAHMRDNAMNMRMMPVGQWFEELIADIKQHTGGSVTLQASGGATELDLGILQALQSPVKNLLRACTTSEATEPNTGSLRISALKAGEEVVIDIFDQVSSSGAPAALAEAVGATVQTLRGSFEALPTSDRGTQYRLRLPVTQGIIDGLLIAVNDQRFVLPLAMVEEIVDLETVRGDHGHSQDIINLRGSLVPFVRLANLFDLAENGTQLASGHAVVMRDSHGQRAAVVVDRVIGQHQTVVKRVSPMCGNATVLSGTTILGDGTVALILDVSALWRACTPVNRN